MFHILIKYTLFLQVKEWLCLNCQMQRALSAAEPTGPPVKHLHGDKKISPSAVHQKAIVTDQVETKKEIKSDAAPKMETPGAYILQKKDTATLGSPQKTRSTAVAPSSKEAKGPKSEGHPSPTPGEKKPLDISVASGPEKPTDQGSQPGLKQTSTLISSAVQDESRTTPPSSRKMSAPAQVSPKMSAATKSSPKSTPTVSPKMSPAREPKTLPQKPEQKKKPEESHQSKDDKALPQVAKVSHMAPNAGQTTCPLSKVDKVPSEPPKVPVDTQGASKADQSVCPLCKVKLTVGPTDPPNYNTCTECKTTVCNQCGFNPVPDDLKVKEWLCLNCQMQRALGVSEAIEPTVVKPQPMPSKVSTPPRSEQKDTPTLVQKEKAAEYADVQKEATQIVQPRKEILKGEAPVPTAVQRMDKAQQDSVEKAQGHAQDVASQPKLVEKPPQGQISQPTKPEVKSGFAKQEAGKLPQQPSKPLTQSPKPAPPPAQPAKQESGGFFGFGAPKPTVPKPAESVTGKMFGFGSSILSSASTLITSAVQDEPKVTPPTPRKMSTTTSVSPKPTPPVSPKMPPVKDSKPPATQTPDPLQQAKATPLAQDKVLQVAPKESLSTCLLCKVKLNVGTKEPPNYNTCTECKNIVCNLCGFNPMPHTAVKEWLCLNCQTQRALSGQLGDSGKMPQPSPPPAKSETQATPVTTKAEPKTTSTKSETRPGPTKSQPTPVPVETAPTVSTIKANVESTSLKMETTLTAASTHIELETTPLPTKEEVLKQRLTEVTPTIDVLDTDATKKEEVPKTDFSTTKLRKTEESKTDLHKDEFEAGVAEPSSVPVPDASVVSASPVTPEVAVAQVIPEAQTKQDLSVAERIIKVVDTDDRTILTDSSKSLQQIMVQPESKEQQQVVMEGDAVTILPILHELNDEIVSGASKDGTDSSIPAKEEINAKRRRLSFQAMDESSESELTPSPSPKVQKRRLKVSNISSSSEDIKTESADSSVEDEEFIRKQIMGMGDEEEMSVSEDEKEKNLENVQAIKDTDLDNTLVTVKPLSRKGSTDNEDSPARNKAVPKTDSMTAQSVPETLPRTTFKKAIPVMRQRQSTDEEIESITESVSKGSSSVQASSFTPESSPTSASSLEEDSDSSPSRRKPSGDKQYRKGKHRQPTQPLPTIEDSSEEEKMGPHGQLLSPHKDSSSTEDLKEVTVIKETHRTSGSEYSASIESESEATQAVQRGRKPSPTVIPYTLSDPFIEKDSVTKSLKSAEEAYEEIIQKTKAIPGDSPPDIEPLYGGMAIEDYLYESLVEEPEIKMSESREEPKNDTGSDSLKKLRSPEEVYEEMMQKKRELMMIEHEFQQAQNAMESSASSASQVTCPPSFAETCVVTIEETYPTEKLEMPLTETETLSDMSVKKKKRPAPPRPSEPPKRPDITVVPSTPSGAISFVRPMIQQDPALRKALFPIPDLKITQCSSGEEEDDSLADDYGIGISSDITPSDDSQEEPCISPSLSETVEMDPICVVCEIPEPKPIPTPISAPELTTTPSPVSPVSPPTSPASADSSLASNATSSSPFQAQTPLSSDSTPLSTPTPSASFKTQSPPEISSPLPATDAGVQSNENSVSSSPVTVIVTIPDVVSDPSKAQTATAIQVQTSTVEAITASPVVVQMPDLVSSPSQVPDNIPAISQVSAPSPAPSVVSIHSTTLVAARPVAVSAPTSAILSTSVTLVSCPEPVIVQMPDLVSTTAPIPTHPPLPVSALVTTPAQAETKVVHSVPVQSAIPSVSPVVVPPLAQTAQMPSAATASTTIVKKKVPPPPPPRSTSVSLPETNKDVPFVKPIEHATRTTSPMGTTAVGQPMQSVVVDIQPRMEAMKSDGGVVPQLVTPNRQGHVVIIVPSVENKALIEQTRNQGIPSTGPISFIASAPYGSQVAPHSASDVCSTDISSLPTKVATVQEVVAPPISPKVIDTVEVPITVSSPTPPSTLPKPTVPKQSVPTPVTTAKANFTPVFSAASIPSQTTKPPPPIPPKPVSIPAGLVFSHKPGESVKPPPVAPKAATLPRTKEPPKALSLSLTRPVESKLGATSPKSPVSPRHAKCLQTYVVITLPSEPGSPTESITVQAPVRRGSIPSTKVSGIRTTPSEQKAPIEVFSAQATVRRASVPTVSLVTQVVTTEVQRTTVSVVHERLPQVPPPSVAITIQPDIAKVQPVPKQNGKIYPGDVIDLRTMKVGIKMTEQGMDLTPPESSRQSFSSDSSGRQITAVQPEIVNLSPAITPATTLSVVTDSITIVTCTATIASYSNTPAEKPLDLQGPVTSLPLSLTTYKPFEPLAQIVYRPVSTQPMLSAVASTAQDIPINLSFEALVSSGAKQPLTSVPTLLSNGGPVLSLEATEAMDLTNYKPMRAVVALSGTSPGVVTTVVEDDGTPMDLTAGRHSVCCDVIYKLPFTGSCRTQPPVTSQPDNRFGYRDDHYQYDNSGLYSIKGTNGIKASVSETNLTEAGLFSMVPKSDYDYLSGSSDGAIDLTAAKLSAGEYETLDYTSKTTGVYPLMTTAQYSQIPAAGFGVNSALRTSDGIVYSSVAAPVPSTYAITTQPGSVFSTTLTPTSIVHSQPLPHPYGFIPTTDPGQIIPFDSGLSKDFLPTALADIITGYPEMYSDATLEAIAASLDALASSPIFPGLDNTKMAQYQMEREFLELEKLKQLCLAEELEWERQEIQRYREQEQLMVQRELEELQALKQQLLLQQEEEHHAHMVAQQETYAQQKEQLQQIQQLQLQLQRQLDEHYGSTGPTGNLLDAKYAGVGDSGQYWPVRDESTTPSAGTHIEESQDLVKLQADQDIGKKIIDSGVQTDDEDSAEKQHVGRRKKNKRNIDSSAQTDDEDQDEWDAPTKARRRSRKHSSDGKHGSKVSSIAIQTVAEISVQTDHSGTIKRPNVQMDTKVEIIKHISAPENSQRGGSLSCQTDSDRRHASTEVGYSTHLSADIPAKSKTFYTTVSPLSPEKSLGGQRMLTADPTRFSSGPRILKAGQKSLSDPKSLSPSTEDRMGGYYSRGSPSSTGKKVKRTLPDPPPEDDSLSGRSGYSTNSARRRLARSTTMARAKILQDIDKELDLVERESSKLRKKQAELDEEEKEIDAKLRYLEMGINRRKEALLKEREKRERAYLQGVAEERDYMSDSEVSNIRETRGDGLERPRTAPQSEFEQFIPPQTEADSQYNTLTSPYSHYGQYVPQTQTTSHYTQQNLYQQQSLYHQQVSPYPTMSLSHAQTQPGSYQHALLLQQGKQRQTNLSDLEPKITTNYEVIRNQPLLIVPTSTESGYGVAHLGGKYGSLDLRLGLEERSMASSPMSSISADSFYADIDHHNARNYVLIEDIGELTKASTGLSNTGLGSGFNLPDKEMSKADRLRRTAEVAEFLGSSRLQSYGKGEDDTMEEPYELKLLKQQIKQEFRRGTEGLEHLTGLGLPQYLPSDSNFRHFPKGEKYSIGRLTLEKQAAKQLPAAMLYQKQMKNKKALIDPKAITKFSPIQESRDLEPEYGSYMGSGASSVSSLAARARLLQDEITFGLRKNLSEQQKYLGSSLGANLSGSLNLGQSLGLGSTIRATAHDDGTYPSGTRSRPSSRPSSVYGLDLSIKRDLSSSSLRLKSEGEVLDAAFAPGVARAKPTSLPISQSRGRIPIVAQNSEEESPLSPVGQPMGMARASAGPLPPISADSRDQFGSSHSLPEVQQHMREESRTRGYDRDIAFIMDDLQGAMSDSEAYHLRREDTDWFDKPREGHPQSGSVSDRRQVRFKLIIFSLVLFFPLHMKLVPYAFPHTRIKLKRDMKDSSVSGNGLGIRVVGGKEIPGSRGEIGAYIAKVIPGGVAEQTGKVVEGMQVLEWNGVPLTGKTYEEVQSIMGQTCAEAELCVRLDLNMLSDPEHPQALEHHVQLKRSPGVDPKQLAAELQKVSQQQAPGMVGVGAGGLGVLSALERSALLHSGTGSAASSGVPSPGQPASPAISKKQRHKQTEMMKMPHPITGEIQLQINYDRNLGNLIVHVLQARNLAPRDNDAFSILVLTNIADNKRRTKYAQKTMNPEWNQTVIYKNIHLEQLKKKTLEVTVWDYDRSSSNDFLGEVLIDLSNTTQLDNTPRWLPLKEQSESIEHSRAHHGDGNMQMMPLEKSHSSPGSSKSSSDGQLRSHGPSRSQSKSSVTQAHLEDAGIAIAAAEAAVQQSCLQPRPGHRLSDVSGSVVLSAPSLVGDAYGGLDSEDGAGIGVDTGKTQVMGEIKVALKKEVKTEGDQLVLEILQCRNITYKFKSPDHLPDLYVKLYVVNVATQKRIIKKKTRICRHDREPSFNETFRFPLNPTGHSIQLFLVSNGGKFMKKTLIGEAYIWLDKVDMRKRVVSWHKLFVSSTQTNP
uniref:Protein piccolo-like n=1 Tax=Pundamilia nyererei TaxID=303518 RepID=A0A3B4FIG6_9CICH